MKSLYLILLLCCAFFVMPAHAQLQNTFDMSGFETLPIQAEGRIQPLETFARNTLKSLSGQTHLEGISAAQWLAQSLFAPEKAIAYPVIFIPNIDLQHSLHLERRKGHLYRLDEVDLSERIGDIPKLLAAQSKGQKLSGEDKDLLSTYKKILIYTQVLRSFTFEADFSDGNDPKTYLDFLPEIQDIETRVQQIVKSKGTNPELYTGKEQQLVNLAMALSAIREGGETNTLFKVIPVTLDADDPQWSAPWEIYTRGAGTPESGAFLEDWSILRKAYLTGDHKMCASTIQELKSHYKPYLQKSDVLSKLSLESLYMKWQPFGWAFGLYLAALLSLLLSIISKAGPFGCIARWGFSLSYCAALIVLAAAITARSYLLGRPPVGTLYESLLFAAFIIGLAGAGLDRFMQKQLYRGLAALLALFLLAVSFFALPDQHGLNVLQAVLNTQFWLATHVLCVTIGYGLCLLAAALAHAHLFRKAFMDNQGQFGALQETRLSAGFALLFMSVGTALGGIWADQSWGRFWGWDPKENGALLIVLWLVWLLHGLVSRDLKEFGFLIGVAATGIFVALSWFGVNLLNIGLHSYGFIDGVAQGLGVYILFQCVILGVLAMVIIRKKRTL